MPASSTSAWSQRNEANAIIVHGTMCLIRRTALDRRRRLVERHHLRGHRSRPHHPRARLGRALHQPPLRPRPPARHLRGLQEAAPPLGLWRLPDRRASTGAASCRARACSRRDQKREFALGWLNWLGAESVGVVVAILNLIWVPVVAFVGIAVPDKILTLPIIAAFAVSVAALRRALPRCASRSRRAGDRRACSPPWRCSGRSRARSPSA